MSLLDLINQKRTQLQRGNKNRPEKLSSERNLIRILPSWTGNDEGKLWQDWGQHFIKDQSGQLKAVYICTQTCFDEACPVCEAIAQGAAMNSDEDTLRVLKDSRSSTRVLVNALYLKGGKHDNPETTPVVLDLPPTVFDMILAAYKAYNEEGVNVFDLNEGVNFIIEKTGTGMNTEYKVTPAPRSTKVDKSIMEKVQDLTAWARQESEAEKAKAITSVKVISGQPVGTTAPRLVGPAATAPARTESRLASVNVEDAIDADFVDLGTKGGDSDIDDFLAGLD